jgi:hypothetical protein
LILDAGRKKDFRFQIGNFRFAIITVSDIKRGSIRLFGTSLGKQVNNIILRKAENQIRGQFRLASIRDNCKRRKLFFIFYV